MKEDCVFCKIINGSLPCYKIYENEHILAFLDINPVNKGHTLIIPKEHYERLEEVPDDLLKELIIAIKKIGKAVIKGVGAEAFNLGLNNGKDAGQLIMLVHFHIMPRFKNDGLKLWPGKKYEEGEAEKIREEISKYIS